MHRLSVLIGAIDKADCTLQGYDAATARIEAISTGLGSQNTVQDLHFVYDTLGNLIQRSDTRQNLTESFDYDPLNRLLQARLNATGSPSFTSTQDISYDSIGNITYKSGIGFYRYGASTAGPHAVTQTHLGATVFSNFSYDANGNQLSGNGRNQTYTAFNNLRISSKGSNTTRFDYDPERQRIFQSSVEGGVTTNTVYVGGITRRSPPAVWVNTSITSSPGVNALRYIPSAVR